MLELGAKRELYGVWKKSKGAKGLFVGPNNKRMVQYTHLISVTESYCTAVASQPAPSNYSHQRERERERGNKTKRELRKDGM